jgi:hypothetical protein
MAEAYAEPGGLDPTDPDFRYRRRTRSARSRKTTRRIEVWSVLLVLAAALAAAGRILYDAWR